VTPLARKRDPLRKILQLCTCSALVGCPAVAGTVGQGKVISAAASPSAFPSQPVGTSSGTSASTSPNPLGTATPMPEQSASQIGPRPSPVNSTCAPLDTPQEVGIIGRFYDQNAVLISDVFTVRVDSQDVSTPFTATTMSKNGSYGLANVPLKVNLLITVTGAGWKTQSRTINLNPTIKGDCGGYGFPTGSVRVNFGSPSADDPQGSQYFLTRQL
jgi:hypothetical protein